MVQRLLLLPLLSPLLAVLLVAALNPRPAVSLRLLVWRSPALSIGAWLAAAGAGGALLSAAATGLALQPQVRPPRRQTRRRAEQEPAPWDQDDADRVSPPPPRPRPTPRATASPGPQRRAGDPAPTVSVPFRVIQRPQDSRQPRHQEPPPVPTASGTGQTDDRTDDWAEPIPEAW